MLFSPRISSRQLASLCGRFSTSLEAGLDLRNVLARESSRSLGPTARRKIGQVRDAVAGGGTLAEALDATGDYFPVLFRELARVGEQTGHLGEAFGHLAAHYDTQVKLRRMFLASIAWPMLQLAVALAVIGFLIWILGVIGESTGTTTDILGFGLVGNRGLAIYVGVLMVVGAAVALLIHAVRRGLVWTRPIQRLVLQLPGLGPPLQTIAIARLAWVLHLTMDAGVDLRKSLKLALQSTGNARYVDAIPTVDRVISSGDSIEEAFRQSGAFPGDFLDAVAVGEQSGRLVESLAVLSRQYHQRADTALKVITMIAGFLVWALVAALIILMIFRLFSFYLGAIQNAAKM